MSNQDGRGDSGADESLRVSALMKETGSSGSTPAGDMEFAAALSDAEDCPQECATDRRLRGDNQTKPPVA